MVDYASSYVEIAKLTETTSSDVILHLRSIFARQGIPETVVSDNWPQFAQFANKDGFVHCNISPRYPRSNGKAERSVQTVKTVLKKSVDPYGALLAYRTTPIESDYSPAELLMGRQLRTSVPVLASTLHYRWQESKQLLEQRQTQKRQQTEASSPFTIYVCSRHR